MRNAMLTRRRAARADHGLYSQVFGAILSSAMKHWTFRQLSLLFLAVFVAAGMGVSAAQASDMAASMATMSEMDMSAEGGCEDCPNQSPDSGMKTMACGTVCAAPVLAALPTALPLPSCEKAGSLLPRDTLLRGRALPPDPYPPRTSDIG
ncbi:hypothetical protein CN172_20020 [Sinorhizobium meliloti]|nr:hypothetical protein [Sinorhizobium meliloti]MDW9387487.1 hypothetical protein [Sinorhizobium meliloti]MDW9602088.1 hypothetical protein [Sinorhizobium meliloti]MQV06168.1 hypothetical protein [Sinorhizobium meliloti]RVE97514.1 hypothetical protein CN232_21770 [Sinorhizobium meliloti]